MTEDVSRVAAPWAFSVVEGEEVDMGLLCVDFVLVVCEGWSVSRPRRARVALWVGAERRETGRYVGSGCVS